jgi:hypothetical protein
MAPAAKQWPLMAATVGTISDAHQHGRCGRIEEALLGKVRRCRRSGSNVAVNLEQN